MKNAMDRRSHANMRMVAMLNALEEQTRAINLNMPQIRREAEELVQLAAREGTEVTVRLDLPPALWSSLTVTVSSNGFVARLRPLLRQ